MIDDNLIADPGPNKFVPPHLRTISGKDALTRPEYQFDPAHPVPARPLTYLASPYSTPDKMLMEWRYEEATRAAAWLIRNMKWNVFAPITHSHPLAKVGGLDCDWEFWKQIDTEYLSVCKRLVVLELPGWRKSVGVNAEIEIARKMGGIEIVYMRPSMMSLNRYDLAPYPMDEQGKPGFDNAPAQVMRTEPDPAPNEVVYLFGEKTPAVTSKATTANPKDVVGSTKVSLSKVPAVAIAHCAHAMMDGARKYDPYNWRAKDVQASIYVDAAQRHIMDWFEGEEDASDSKVHHLGHAMACCAILLDCQENDCLIDDRPVTPKSKGVISRVFDRLRKKIAEMPPIDRSKL